LAFYEGAIEDRHVNRKIDPQEALNNSDSREIRAQIDIVVDLNNVFYSQDVIRRFKGNIRECCLSTKLE